MPRQLPWVNKGGRSRVQAKQPPAKKQRVSAENGDDFFDGTVLHSGNARIIRAGESDDDLPDLPAEPSTPRTKRRSRISFYENREESSSPPPIQDLAHLQVEQMRKGMSKFDLRDDEWMMVEDELLETAKLFTRHLHIAEYEKLKEKIEAKKKEVETPRPVVSSAKMSDDGTMRMKAKDQEKKQKKAIRDIFASQNDEDDLDLALPRTTVNRTGSTLTSSTRIAASASRSAIVSSTVNNSDSDDLDALRPDHSNPYRSQTAITPKPRVLSSSLVKTSVTSLTTSEHGQNGSSANSFGDWGSSGVRKDTADRLAKRRADREKEENERTRADRKAVRSDEIPTFLF